MAKQGLSRGNDINEMGKDRIRSTPHFGGALELWGHHAGDARVAPGTAEPQGPHSGNGRTDFCLKPQVRCGKLSAVCWIIHERGWFQRERVPLPDFSSLLVLKWENFLLIYVSCVCVCVCVHHTYMHILKNMFTFLLRLASFLSLAHLHT